MMIGNKGGESFRPMPDISDESKVRLFGVVACDYGNNSGVFEVDATTDQYVVIVSVGPNTDLPDADKLIDEVEGRPVLYHRSESMPVFLVLAEDD